MSTEPLDHLDPQQLRALVERLMGEAATREAQLVTRDAQMAAYDAQK